MKIYGILKICLKTGPHDKISKRMSIRQNAEFSSQRPKLCKRGRIFFPKNWQLYRNSGSTYEKCEGGGHGDGEYDEEDGEAAPGAAGGRQLFTQAAQPSSPSSSSTALLQLTSAPAT